AERRCGPKPGSDRPPGGPSGYPRSCNRRVDHRFLWSARQRSSPLTRCRVRAVQFGSVDPLATQAARFQSSQHNTVCHERALDGDGIAMRQRQVLEVSNHKTPVIMQEQFDIEAGSDRFGTPLDARGKKKIASPRIEVPYGSLEPITV